MSRAMEDWVCASEDRWHYDNDTWYPYGFQTPMVSPEVTIINQIVKTEIIEQKISEEELNELIEARIPQLVERVTAEASENIIPEITEIHGGSASEVLEGGN